MSCLRRLLPYFRPYRHRIALGLSTIALAVAFGLVTPLLVGRAVDALRSGAMATILRYALFLILATGIRGLFTFAQRLILVTVSRDVELDLRNDLFAHLQTLSAAARERRTTGDLMARATNDLAAVRMLCGPAIMYSTNTLFTALGCLVLMLQLSPTLTLLSLAPMPLVAVLTKLFGQRIHRLFQAVQEQFAELTTRVQENFAGIRVVRAYAQEADEQRLFGAVNEEYVARSRHLILWSSAFHPLLQALVGVGFVVVLWFGGRQVIDDAISIGDFVAFNFFLTKLIWPMIAIGWVVNLAQRGAASLARLLEVIDEVPEIRDLEPSVSPPVLHGAVRFAGLSFRYAGSTRAALEGVDLEAPAGSMVAIVGRTGAGKSTLLSLIPRLLDPPPGELLVDGLDVRRIPMVTLRNAVAMVSQESFLFSASIAENIAFGRPAAEPEEIRRAALWAGLEEDLGRFPRGLETRVGERGITLSGGQKQRVALARALVRRPRILLLDDCFSAVDTTTEERILRGLDEAVRGMTVFLVSHRVSTVSRASQIIVLEDGRVAERGTHRQLLGSGGLYADLARRQQLEEELAAI